MRPLTDVIKRRTTTNKPIWIMRQAGRYLPEFRKIRRRNKNFIKLCLNKKLVPEITMQPLKRFDFDAAIIFSDILMLPLGLGQKVSFKKNFGPILGSINDIDLKSISEIEFTRKLKPVYESISTISKKLKDKEKNLIGFVGAPWTLLVYMVNRKSPKKKITKDIFNNIYNEDIIKIVVKYLKIHIKNQIKSGANIIQIFDSWAGLVPKKYLQKFIYDPTAELVEFARSKNIPCICFPRQISDYKTYVKEVVPDAINIDYSINKKKILRNINIPIQGGLDPKILLKDKKSLKTEVDKILEIFKDHPYIFNLGHGVLPETKPDMMKYLVKLVKDFNVK